MDLIRRGAASLAAKVDSAFAGQPTWKVVLTTTTTSVAVTYLLMYISQLMSEGDEPWTKQMRKYIIRKVTSLPFIKQKIEEKISEVREDINKNTFALKSGHHYERNLPEEALQPDEIIQKLCHYQNLDEYDIAKISGQIYQNNSEVADLCTKVFGMYSYSNPLHADVFQDVRKIEAETSKWVCDMFHGDEHSRGMVTTGGSESLLLAVLAARNRAYHRGIRYPEVVLPVTAHAAFDKACFYFRVRIVHVQINKDSDFAVNMAKYRKAINRNTCLLVGSFPEFPFGLTDPIEEISKLGVKYDIPVHVDACLGGFVAAFLTEEHGNGGIGPYDFRLPGVMSISCDTHKYGFAPKGTSVLLFRTVEYMHDVYFSQPDWPGGIYATPTTGGSRSGGNIATAWAAMLSHGVQGYTQSANQIANTTKAIAKGIASIEGLKLMGDPKICVVSWHSDKFDIWRQYEMLKQRDWVLGTTQFPGGIHLTVTMRHVEDGWLESFLSDVRETAAECMKNPEEKASGQAAIYGMAQTIPDRSLVQEMTYMFWDRYYSTL